MELHTSDRVCWTRNNKTLVVVNCGVAEVAEIRNCRVRFLLEDGRAVTLDRDRAGISGTRKGHREGF
ncbi:MAG: hypothetical protein OXD01_03270 [Gammaproteobacteria bacterium]|nr:hypothetical protein [Gammaproteobacteria bacterium]